MGLIRLLLFVALVWLVVRLVRSLAARPGPKAGEGARRGGPSGGSLDGGELVQDPSCGVYIPKATALPGPAGRFFCSEACRDAHGRRPAT